MNEIATVILSMSLSGGVVIIMLYLVLLLYGKKFCRQWQYYIWLIAIIRLLLPFAPQQNLINECFHSVKPFMSSIKNSSLERLQNKQTQMEDFKTNVSQSENIEDEKGNVQSQKTNFEISGETVDQTSEKERTGKLFVLSDIVRRYLWLAWLLPAMILFIRKIIVYERYVQYICAGSKEVQDIVLLKEFSRLMEKNHIHTRITLSVNSAIMSPVMIGFFKPCIILSTTQITVLEFQHTISHELIHYKRKDILYKWLTQLVVCIHWFNPLLYIMEQNINRACELSCDEAVIWNLDEQERYAYGDTLLQAAGKNVKFREPVPPISFSNNTKNLKERLGAIMNFKKISKAAYIAMFSLTIILFACSSYIGVYAASEKAESVTDTSKTKVTKSRSAQAPHSVIYKNGEYFILFDGAEEKDLPGSTGPDYGVTFGAVWPDAYVSFDSYYINKKLSSKIKKDCKYFQNKGWLTKKETNAIIDVALKVQQGDTDEFKTAKQEKEYAKWNIIRKNGGYYYNNKRIRILMDTRKDRSLENLSYNYKGKTDIKIIRNSDNKIIKVKYLSKKKAKEILNDLID